MLRTQGLFLLSFFDSRAIASAIGTEDINLPCLFHVVCIRRDDVRIRHHVWVACRVVWHRTTRERRASRKDEMVRVHRVSATCPSCHKPHASEGDGFRVSYWYPDHGNFFMSDSYVDLSTMPVCGAPCHFWKVFTAST